MAKPTARHPSSSSSHLTLRVLALVVLVALAAAGAVAGWAEWRIRNAAPATGPGDLDAAVRAQSRADAQRLEELTLVAARLARRADLPLGAPEEEGDEGTDADPEESAASRLRGLVGELEDVLDERQVELIVLRGGGEMALRVGAPAEAAREMAVSAPMTQALEEGRASGAWSFDGRLYRLAAERVEVDGEPVGAIAVADLVGRATAIEARAVSRAEAVYLLAEDEGAGGATLVASTLDQEAGEGLVAALAEAGALDEAFGGGRPDPVAVRLGGTPYRAVAARLDPGAGGASAVRVALLETGAGSRLLRMVQAAALAGGLGAILLGLIGAPLVAHGAGAQSKEVVAAARAARAGDLAGAARHGVPVPLGLFFQEAAEKRALESVVASLGRFGGSVPEGAGASEGQAARRKGAVLVVEMPRYSRVPADQDPREVAERLGRDLVRVRRAVSSRDGRLEASLGHRALAVFDGERAGARAVGAAAEVMKELSAPENAFDDPVPPAAAVATGSFIAGGPEGARAVTGLPVQQAESLLREATSGDLVVAAKAFRELEGELGAAGVEVAAQRGLLTSQPVYLLDPEKAARAARAVGTAEGAARAALSSLASGETLADRFTLLESRGANPVWVRYLAHDGETDSRVTVRAVRPDAITGVDVFDSFDGPLQTIQRVVDPSVERVIAVGASGGVPYLVSERVEGPSLHDLLTSLLAQRQPLAAPAALRIARGIAAGLAAIHGAGVAHGALRPASVALDPRGRARVTELGLGLALPSPGIDPAVDRVLGPPRHLAPERRAGGEATPAADVYAAGALLAELFSGRELATGEDGAPVLPDATELPDGLAPLLARCLEADPEARYTDGAELLAALDPIHADIVTTG